MPARRGPGQAGRPTPICVERVCLPSMHACDGRCTICEAPAAEQIKQYWQGRWGGGVRALTGPLRSRHVHHKLAWRGPPPTSRESSRRCKMRGRAGAPSSWRTAAIQQQVIGQCGSRKEGKMKVRCRGGDRQDGSPPQSASSCPPQLSLAGGGCRSVAVLNNERVDHNLHLRAVQGTGNTSAQRQAWHGRAAAPPAPIASSEQCALPSANRTTC